MLQFNKALPTSITRREEMESVFSHIVYKVHCDGDAA